MVFYNLKEYMFIVGKITIFWMREQYNILFTNSVWLNMHVCTFCEYKLHLILRRKKQPLRVQLEKL